MKLINSILILLISAPLVWAQGILKGKITDENGESVPGVAIQKIGTSVGTISNEDGSYSLALENGNHEIAYSFLGYSTITKNITINSADVVMDVDMSSAATVLQEVVISTGSTSSQQGR